MKKLLPLAGFALAILVFSGLSWAGDARACCYEDGSCRNTQPLWCENQGGVPVSESGLGCAEVSCEPEEQENCSPRVRGRGAGWWRNHPGVWYGVLCDDGNGECDQIMADLNARGSREDNRRRHDTARMLISRFEETVEYAPCE